MKSIRTLKDIITKFFALLDKKQTRRCYILFVAMLIGSLLETLGISSVIPLVTAILDVEKLRSNHIANSVLTFFDCTTDFSVVILMALLIVFVYVIKDTYLSLYAYLKNRYERTLQQELAVKAFRSYLSRPYSYYLDANTAEVLRGISTDVDNSTNLYIHMNVLFNNVLSVILIGSFLVWTDWTMAIGVLTICGVCFVGIMLIFKRKVKGIGDQDRVAQYETNLYGYQAVDGIKEINVMRKMDYFLNRYETSYKKRKKILIRLNFINALPNRIIEVVCIAAMMLIVCVKIGTGDADSNLIFVTNLSAFVIGAFKVLPSVSTIASEINAISYCRPSLNACYENMVQVDAYLQERSDYRKLAERDSEAKLEFNNILEVSGIDWTYPKSERKILKQLSMCIHKGESIGLVGESGSGKTTLADIILGLYQPQAGTVCLDGVDIYAAPEQWADIVGYVPQNVFLLDDNLRNNILFGVGPEEADEDKIWDVLEQAQLKDYVKQLPDGLDTMLGEKGIKFSGGQRQRVAIARALYREPQILVLDEATSALDNDTEKAVMEAIEHLQGKITLLIVAHRLTTIRKCDVIYEIKDGKATRVNRDEG